MRIFAVLVVILCLQSPVTAQQTDPPIAAPTSTDASLAAVNALISHFIAASNANDVKAFASVFAEDADFTNVFGQPAKGRRAVEAFHAPYYREPREPGLPSFVHAHLSALDSRIRLVRPDVAAVDIRWQQTGALNPDGKPWGTRVGLMSWLVTQDNGVWAIVVMHNMELPAIPQRWER